MITLIDTASFNWKCVKCGASNTQTYAAMTIGISDPDGSQFCARVLQLTCSGCNALTNFVLPSGRLTIGALCLHEIFQKGLDASCTVHADYATADIEALLSGSAQLTDYETLPFTSADMCGRLHFDAALAKSGATAVAEMLRQGIRIYGTDSDITDDVDKVITDASTRKTILQAHGINTP